MRKNVPLQVTWLLPVAAMQAIVSPTGFAVADFNEPDDDPGNWGDPIED